jgi:hypothetical protein
VGAGRAPDAAAQQGRGEEFGDARGPPVGVSGQALEAAGVAARSEGLGGAVQEPGRHGPVVVRGMDESGVDVAGGGPFEGGLGDLIP